MTARSAAGLSVLGGAFPSTRKELPMEVVLAAMRLLTGLFGATRAYLELMGSRGDEDDQPNARKHRPRHLRE